MKVWRIQNEHGEGPYANRSQDWVDEFHCSDTGRPEPEQEQWRDMNGKSIDTKVIIQKMFDHPKKYWFGFITFKQLQNWFSITELARLSNKGFYVYTVDAKVLYISSKQCIFEKAQ